MVPTLSIVDDNNLVGRSLKRVISSSGYRVEAFASAEEFLVSDYLNECNCLILDLHMPSMNGLQLQRQLQMREFGFPIIFITSSSDETSKVQALQAGAADYLHKPFTEDQLLDAIRKAFGAAPRASASGLSCEQPLADVCGTDSVAFKFADTAIAD